MVYNKERSRKTREFISNTKNGIAVVILSGAAMFLVPLVGSYLSGETKFPETIPQWILYFACSLAISICCLCIFLALFNQGKLNVKDEPEYQQAKELHLKNFKRMNKKVIPIDPFKWEKQQKVRKGIIQTIGMFFGLLGFGLAVISWNNSQFISATISVILAIAFGFIKMGDVERMFTEGWLEYELYIEEMLNEEDKNKAILETLDKEPIIIPKEEENAKLGDANDCDRH